MCVVELDKPCYCNLKVVNNSEHHVAFKVRAISIPRRRTDSGFPLCVSVKLLKKIEVQV